VANRYSTVVNRYQTVSTVANLDVSNF